MRITEVGCAMFSTLGFGKSVLLLWVRLGWGLRVSLLRVTAGVQVHDGVWC